MISKFRLLRNLKTYLTMFTLAASILFGIYNYTVYLGNKVDSLTSENAELVRVVNGYERVTRELETTLNDNNKMLLGEISSLQKSFTRYEGMLADNRRNVLELSKYMSEIQNEQIQTCLNTELPDDLVDRLFNKTKVTAN